MSETTTWTAQANPAPAGPPNPTNRRIVTLVVAGALALLLGAGALMVKVPYVELVPNEPCDTLASCGGNEIVSIPHHRTYPTSGHLYLTDVGIIGSPDSQISLGQALRGWLDDSIAVVPQDVIYPPEQSTEVTQQQNTQEMLDSQRDAKAAALNALGLLPVRLSVGAFAPTSPARQAGLHKGDVITAIDGKATDTVTGLTRLIGKHPVGDTVEVTVRRNGTTRTYDVGTVQAGDGRTIIGIQASAAPTGKMPFRIDIGLENVGGPSAGLMFALGIYDKLTKAALTGGASVAGTGTIGADGTVGPIGGIEQKVVGARRAGATAFLTPAANCADAVSAKPDGLRLIRVRTFDDALSALASLRGEHGVIHDC